MWLVWDSTRWKEERTLKAFDLARILARDFANALDPEDRSQVASATTVAAIERLARADRRHAAVVEQWDADSWVLNTPAGIVDLRTGAVLPHDPAQYMTKITAVAPDGECPLWQKFLDEITGGDRALQAFLQRLAGYTLTGSVREHALFFFTARGAMGRASF
jgi:putative DNA primase/helicase